VSYDEALTDELYAAVFVFAAVLLAAVLPVDPLLDLRELGLLWAVPSLSMVAALVLTVVALEAGRTR
jgi:hypothetical protein